MKKWRLISSVMVLMLVTVNMLSTPYISSATDDGENTTEGTAQENNQEGENDIEFFVDEQTPGNKDSDIESPEEYIPPTASAAVEQSSSWDSAPTYTPSIVISDEMIEPVMESGEPIFERSKVLLILSDGSQIDLGIQTQNEKIYFSKEKQIYEAIVAQLKNMGEEVYYLNDINKIMISYNGQILISYASGEKKYQDVIDGYSKLGKTAIQFQKM